MNHLTTERTLVEDADSITYMTDEGPILLEDMTKEKLIELIRDLLHDQRQTYERHHHEREMLALGSRRS